MAIDDNTSYELTGYQVKDLANKVRAKADSSSLASVATSGLYSDLTGKPTIPTVNNGTLTLVQNGTTVGTFTANQSTNTTVNLAGGVYADDPTAPANPNAWITGSDVDWTTTAQSYSTTEVNTGATWVDGRKIYKKTISCGGGSNRNKAVNHNIFNLRRTIKIEGQAYDGSVCIPIPFTATGDGTHTSIQIYVSSTQVVINCGADRDNLTEMYITLWYTKTTG